MNDRISFLAQNLFPARSRAALLVDYSHSPLQKHALKNLQYIMEGVPMHSRLRHLPMEHYYFLHPFGKQVVENWALNCCWQQKVTAKIQSVQFVFFPCSSSLQAQKPVAGPLPQAPLLRELQEGGKWRRACLSWCNPQHEARKWGYFYFSGIHCLPESH